jgi:hypothetical protein
MVTGAERDIGEMRIGLNCTMNALFLKDPTIAPARQDRSR